MPTPTLASAPRDARLATRAERPTRMATPRTEITEIVTGLGMLGFASLEHAITVRPALVRNVEAAHFTRLEDAFASGAHRREFVVAWTNGEVFARTWLCKHARRLVAWKPRRLHEELCGIWSHLG